MANLKKKNKFNISEWAPKDVNSEDQFKKNKKKQKVRNMESDDQAEDEAIIKAREEERKAKERADAINEQNKMKEIH